MREYLIYAVALLAILALVSSDLGAPPAGRHHGKPTPTPSPPPTPTPTATPPPTPTPTSTPTPTPNPSVTLAWDAVNDPSVLGYHLWEGSAPGAETMLAGIVTSGPLTVTLTLASGPYYFVVTAYNNAGDSLPSNEVSYTVP